MTEKAPTTHAAHAPHAPPAPAVPADPVIAEGTCHIMFAYDIGLTIDLKAVAERLRASPDSALETPGARRPLAFIEIQPAPLRVTRTARPVSIAGLATGATVECTLFDFGAVSIMYSVPLAGKLSGLQPLAEALYENAALRADSRERLDELRAAIASAVRRPQVAARVEDYAVYQIERLEPGCPPGALCAAHAPALARTLRAADQALSGEEVEDALSTTASYTPLDLSVIDWNAAILLGPELDDVRVLLEAANVELLELRHLDDRLDAVLEEALAAASRFRWRDRLLPGKEAAEVRRIAELQTDSAVLFEGVNNSLKLIGDQFLARVYRRVAQRFRLPEWDASIIRKLRTAEDIYDKLTDRQNTRRMELLEWIVIVLIALEIVLAFVH